MVVDTDVLIDDLRDQADAVAFLEGCTQPLVQSVVSVAELYVGVREGEERRRLDGFAALPLAGGGRAGGVVAPSIRPQPWHRPRRCARALHQALTDPARMKRQPLEVGKARIRD